LAVRKPEPAFRTQVVAQGSALTLNGPGDDGPRWWNVLGSTLPLLALLAGLVVVQGIDRQKTVSYLAEIDTALLVDDLPPAAYSDPGFIQFLRQSGDEHPAQD
jgi:hypothetical protein